MERQYRKLVVLCECVGILLGLLVGFMLANAPSRPFLNGEGDGIVLAIFVFVGSPALGCVLGRIVALAINKWRLARGPSAPASGDSKQVQREEATPHDRANKEMFITQSKGTIRLYALLGGAVIIGFLSLVICLTEGWGAWQARILGSLLAISCAGLCALPWAMLWKRKGWKVMPLLGLALVLIGAGLVMGTQWFDITKTLPLWYTQYWSFSVGAAILAVVASYLALLDLMPKDKKHYALIPGGLFILYNLLSGGGCLLERTDSLAEPGGAIKASLSYTYPYLILGETPTTIHFFVPLVFYYIRETYPLHLRVFSGNMPVTDSHALGDPDRPHRARGLADEMLVITEVLYHRQPNDLKTGETPNVIKASNWSEVVITGPGEWTIETKAHVVNRKGEKKPVELNTITIRPTEDDSVFFGGFLWHLAAKMFGNMP